MLRPSALTRNEMRLRHRGGLCGGTTPLASTESQLCMQWHLFRGPEQLNVYEVTNLD
jgi:hypothetical protein